MKCKWIPALMLLALLAVGCRKHGSEFVGKWANSANASDTMEITRNGEQFLVLSPREKLGLGATYKDGFLQIPGAMGSVSLTYVKSSDTLIAPGLFGQNEYKRVDHFSSSSGEVTVDTAAGKITANSTENYSASELGTDIYPGAQVGKGSMRMNLPTGSVITAIYTTSDSKDQVVNYYKSKLGSRVSVFDNADSAVLSLQLSPKETVMVTVSQNGSQDEGKTRISIMHTKSTKG